MARVIILVMDSVGIGALPDAVKYGDEGSNTLVNIARSVGGLRLPQLRALGLGNLRHIAGIPPLAAPLGSFALMSELSGGKDTVTGHWELAGTPLGKPFPLYPQGFAPELRLRLEAACGCEFIGNYAASGTQIIQELGAEHLACGKPILYTSADSVLQIAAHEQVVPLARLYEICGAAREVMQGADAIGRVIARPFGGEVGNFVRTANRRDFALPPLSGNLWQLVKAVGLPTVAIGKIFDIFAGQSIETYYPAHNNEEVTVELLRALAYHREGLIWANYPDFDTLYGHRNDVLGYAQALVRFDAMLSQILGALRDDDLLVITADHGADPTMPGHDHTREYVPLLIGGKLLRSGVHLGLRRTFADVAATAADFLGAEAPASGTSMLPALRL